MKIQTYAHGKYRILKIYNDSRAISDLTELNSLIMGYIANDARHIAVSFTHASYLFSDPISILVNCYKKLRDVGGTLYVLEPKPEMLDLLHQLNLDSLVPIYNSEDDLPQDN